MGHRSVPRPASRSDHESGTSAMDCEVATGATETQLASLCVGGSWTRGGHSMRRGGEPGPRLAGHLGGVHNVAAVVSPTHLVPELDGVRLVAEVA